MQPYHQKKLSIGIQNWLVSASLIFVSFFGVILALICIYALPDGTSSPLIGSVFFIGSILSMTSLLFTVWRREKVLCPEAPHDFTDSSCQSVQIKESTSNKILR